LRAARSRAGDDDQPRNQTATIPFNRTTPRAFRKYAGAAPSHIPIGGGVVPPEPCEDSMQNLMKVFVVLAATATMSSAASAKSYKWCIDDGIGETIRCEFTTKQQCKATASGEGGECVVNPKLLFGKNQRAKAAAR
jgi:hypothetical protein